MLTDSCPRCQCRGIPPVESRRRGVSVVALYRCRCGHAWITSRLVDAYGRKAAA